jgi:hypothetical protein
VIAAELLISLAKRAGKQSANWRRLENETPDKDARKRYAEAARNMELASERLNAAAIYVDATHHITGLYEEPE